MTYKQFKLETIKADEAIQHVYDMNCVSSDFAEGFHKAMWEAREIYMRLQDE